MQFLKHIIFIYINILYRYTRNVMFSTADCSRRYDRRRRRRRRVSSLCPPYFIRPVQFILISPFEKRTKKLRRGAPDETRAGSSPLLYVN